MSSIMLFNQALTLDEMRTVQEYNLDSHRIRKMSATTVVCTCKYTYVKMGNVPGFLMASSEDGDLSDGEITRVDCNISCECNR